MGRANPLRRNLPRRYEDARLRGGLLVLVFSSSVMSDPVDCSLLGSSVHGILQARLLERVAISSFRGSSQPRDRTRVSCAAGRFFTDRATREVGESTIL